MGFDEKLGFDGRSQLEVPWGLSDLNGTERVRLFTFVALALVLSRLRAFSRAGGLSLFRESVVQHFPTRSGSGLYEERTDGRPMAAPRSCCHTRVRATGLRRLSAYWRATLTAWPR